MASRTVGAVWAFSDESERAGVRIVGVVLVGPGQVGAVRASLRALLLPGQRRVHTAKESPGRRRAVLDAVARAEGLTAVALRYRRPAGVGHVAGPQVLIEGATALVVERSVSSWVLDDMAPAERARDRNIIGHALGRLGAQVVFDHRRNHTEPLLWAADAICGPPAPAAIGADVPKPTSRSWT